MSDRGRGQSWGIPLCDVTGPGITRSGRDVTRQCWRSAREKSVLRVIPLLQLHPCQPPAVVQLPASHSVHRGHPPAAPEALSQSGSSDCTKWRGGACTLGRGVGGANTRQHRKDSRARRGGADGPGAGPGCCGRGLRSSGTSLSPVSDLSSCGRANPVCGVEAISFA